jgi:hypothetical protein
VHRDKHALAAHKKRTHTTSQFPTTHPADNTTATLAATPLSHCQLTFPPKRKNHAFIISDVCIHVKYFSGRNVLHCASECINPMQRGRVRGINASVRCSAATILTYSIKRIGAHTILGAEIHCGKMYACILSSIL